MQSWQGSASTEVFRSFDSPTVAAVVWPRDGHGSLFNNMLAELRLSRDQGFTHLVPDFVRLTAYLEVVRGPYAMV